VYQTGEDGQSGGDGGGLYDSGAGEEGVEVSKFTESFWERGLTTTVIPFSIHFHKQAITCKQEDAIIKYSLRYCSWVMLPSQPKLCPKVFRVM